MRMRQYGPLKCHRGIFCELFTFSTSICRLFSGAEWLVLGATFHKHVLGGIEVFLRWKWVYCNLAVALERTFLPFVMYRSNRSFNMPPRAPPRAFDFFENYRSNFPLPGPKCRSNAPHYGPSRWSNAPTPGTFHRHKTVRGTAETPSVVEQNLYKYNKTEKHC